VIRFKGVSATARRLERMANGIPQAAQRAMSRALDTTETHVVRALRRDLGLDREAIARSIEVKKPTFSDLTGYLKVRRYAGMGGRKTPRGKIPLIYFNARGPEPSRGKGSGVRYRLPAPGRGAVTKGFILELRSKHRGVYRRKMDAGRLPIVELYGPSLARVARRSDVMRPARVVYREAFAKRLRHELGRLTTGRGGADGAGA